jgi:AcrR family transcriptional regulator
MAGMGDRSGAGDAARTLALLWRDPAAVPRQGPARSWDIDDVVNAGVALADAGGLDAVTMRAVAQRLGAAPMTLYTYVPGKAELLDLMVDAVWAAMPRRSTAGRPWRERLTAVAEDNRSLYEAHPWVAQVSTGRPPLGPGSIGKYEHELAAFDGLGLSDVDVDASLAHLLAFVQASARAAQDAAAVRRDSALDEQQWWAQAGPLLARVLDPAAFPRAVRVGSAAGTAHGAAADPAHAYRFGLERVLDGLAALIERPVPSAPSELRVRGAARARPVP